MNPWLHNPLDLCRKVIRFALWFAIALNLAMLAIFSIVFTFQFTIHLWGWLDRVMFQGSW